MRLASEVKMLHVSLIRGRLRVRAMPWSKFDPGSAIDRILFELVERELKAVCVIKIVLRPIKFPSEKDVFLLSCLKLRKTEKF